MDDAPVDVLIGEMIEQVPEVGDPQFFVEDFGSGGTDPFQIGDVSE